MPPDATPGPVPASAPAAPVAMPDRLDAPAPALVSLGGQPSAFVAHLALRPPEERGRVLRSLSRTCGNRAVGAILARNGEAEPNPLAGKTLTQLRNLAKKNGDAVLELERRYKAMDDIAELQKAARNDDIAKKVLAEKRFAGKAWTPAGEKAGDFKKWDGHLVPHTARASSTDAKGKAVWSGKANSGGTTPEQKKLDFPERMNVTHTEAKLIEAAKAAGGLQRGGRMIIIGQFDPCSACQNAMKDAAAETGCTIEYRWNGSDKKGHMARFVAKPPAPGGGAPGGGPGPGTGGAKPDPAAPTVKPRSTPRSPVAIANRTAANFLAENQARLARFNTLMDRLQLAWKLYEKYKQAMAVLEAIGDMTKLLAHGTALPTEQHDANEVLKGGQNAKEEAQSQVDDSSVAEWTILIGEAVQRRDDQTVFALDQALIDLTLAMDQTAAGYEELSAAHSQSADSLNEAMYQSLLNVLMPNATGTAGNAHAFALFNSLQFLRGTLGAASRCYAEAAKILRNESKLLTSVAGKANDMGWDISRSKVTYAGPGAQSLPEPDAEQKSIDDFVKANPGFGPSPRNQSVMGEKR